MPELLQRRSVFRHRALGEIRDLVLRSSDRRIEFRRLDALGAQRARVLPGLLGDRASFLPSDETLPAVGILNDEPAIGRFYLFDAVADSDAFVRLVPLRPDEVLLALL